MKNGLSIVSTDTVFGISETNAICGGKLTSDGGLPIIARGVCWSTSQNPTLTDSHTIDSLGIGQFNSNIYGLTHNFTYFVRAYATNSFGTAYGDEVSFTTPNHTYPVYDIDGNGYDTVNIGTQYWLKQNLIVTHYRNGDVIPYVTNGTTWAGLSTAAYCYYNNDTNNRNIYGNLYNWFTAVDSRMVCPTGWHTPTSAEWTTLANYLGGTSIAGGKLKEVGNTHWNTPNVGATNETGFTALPDGYRGTTAGEYVNIGGKAAFWSSNNVSNDFGGEIGIGNNSSGIGISYGGKASGESIRCIIGDLATVSTDTLSYINQFVLKGGGNVINDGSLPITNRGICYSTSQNPSLIDDHTSDSIGAGHFTSYISGLMPNRTYYIRAYATNSFATAYGNEVSFKTNNNMDSIIDSRDGAVYYYVKIGNQNWFAQNSRYLQYIQPFNWASDYYVYGYFGQSITEVKQLSNYKTYGVLYSPNAAQSACPTGWKLPSENDYIELENYLNNNGGKLKEVGTAHWASPNLGATDEYGFSARGSGARNNTGGAVSLFEDSYYWTSTPIIVNSISRHYYFLLDYGSSGTDGYHMSDNWRYSVRCLKVIFATLTTDSVSNIQKTSAICGGNILTQGDAPITARGICWGTSSGPTLSNYFTTDSFGLGQFTSNLTGLLPDTTYFARAYATNSTGTYYGNEVSFKTLSPSLTSTFYATVSNAWENSSNWDHDVPGTITRAIIASNKLAIVNSLNLQCKNLIIEPLGKLTINTDKDLTVNDTLILQSNASGTASLIDNGTLHTTANIVERYIPHTFADEFHMLASPVINQPISPIFNQTDGFYLWNETTGNWIEYADAANFSTSNGGSNFVPGKGYAVSYPAVVTKTFSGNLNTGTINIPLTYTAGLYNGWNFVANPYPSSINWNATNGWTRNILVDAGNNEKAVWIWNPAVANYGAYISNEALGTNNVSRTIPSAQGFWVKAIQSGNLSMSNEIREHSDQLFLKSTNSIPDMLRLSVNGTANSYSDELIIKFGNTNDMGGAEKMFSMDAAAPSLYCPKLNKNWSINMLASVADHAIIPVGFKGGVDGNYSLSAIGVQPFGNVVLEDLKIGIQQNLFMNSSYSFNALTSDNPNRFLLHFSATGITEVNEKSAGIWYNKQIINVYNPWKEITSLFVYDATGKLIETYSVKEGNGNYFCSLAKGVYILKLQNSQHQFVKKEVVY